uniref:Uncharacterized protein n=1 Tax=Serinus canaria TaxID=9135 RepID=A0A8C9NUL7_SERCA
LAPSLQERNGCSARIMASMSCILEQYNHPFENDILISMSTLTYDAPDGPKQWERVSRKAIEKWKKKTFKHHIRSESGGTWINQ